MGVIPHSRHTAFTMQSMSCADCGVDEGEGVSLKACKSCMLVKYCNPTCQLNHWPKHKKLCKQRAAELHDEALFKEPPPKEDCPICFLPMPGKLINCFSFPPATISSVPIATISSMPINDVTNMTISSMPINDVTNIHQELADLTTAIYYSCCGKSICGGCIHSFGKTGNKEKCPFCNADTEINSDADKIENIMKRVDSIDTGAIDLLGTCYYNGLLGIHQDETKAIELWMRAAELGFSKSHNYLGMHYYHRKNSKKAKFHLEAAAMAGHEEARNNIGLLELKQFNNTDRAVKHWIISASAGSYNAMNALRSCFENDIGIDRESLDSTLTAYNTSCGEMRSEARDAFIYSFLGINLEDFN